MDTIALFLVIASGLLHAVWNLLLKKAQDRIAFVWWYLLVPLVLFSPMAVVRWGGEFNGLSALSLGCGLVSGVVQAANLLAMTQAYRGGDLSAAYPLARGSGQVLIVVLGVSALGEKLTAAGVGGLALMVAGVYVVFLPSLSPADLLRPLRLLARRSSLAALAAGGCVAVYHVTDRVGIQGANCLQYTLLLFAADFCAFTAFISFRRRWDLVRAEWRANRASIAIAGSLSLVSYLLVLVALSRERVAYVGPARNVGIVFSVLLGAVFLREKHSVMRFLGSALIVAGLVLAAAGG